MPKHLSPVAPRDLSVPAAAKRMGVSEHRVLRMMAAGQLRVIAEVGRAVKVDTASVDEYLASRGAVPCEA